MAKRVLKESWNEPCGYTNVDNRLMDIFVYVLSGSAYKVYLMLLRYKDNRSDKLMAKLRYRKRTYWADNCGLNVETFDEAIKELKKYRLIRVIKPKGAAVRNHQTNTYRILPIDEAKVPKSLLHKLPQHLVDYVDDNGCLIIFNNPDDDDDERVET